MGVWGEINKSVRVYFNGQRSNKTIYLIFKSLEKGIYCFCKNFGNGTTNLSDSRRAGIIIFFMFPTFIQA